MNVSQPLLSEDPTSLLSSSWPFSQPSSLGARRLLSTLQPFSSSTSPQGSTQTKMSLGRYASCLASGSQKSGSPGPAPAPCTPTLPPSWHHQCLDPNIAAASVVVWSFPAPRLWVSPSVAVRALSAARGQRQRLGLFARVQRGTVRSPEVKTQVPHPRPAH